ncbi:N-terminal cleavage protein [Opitutaceae bacterium TAV5]|nr:N-terminal cleavage protein [Opitutaceae bacterium TAV5]
MNSAPCVSAPSTRLRQRGFTLIELLAVIAIIGILAGILIPVVGAVRGKARAAQCLSNMRQIGLAMNLYADENKDSFPRRYGDSTNGADETKTWMWKLAPYVGMSENLMGPSPLPKAAGIFVCTVFDQKAEGRVVSYGYNWHIRSTAWDYRRGALPAASRTFLVVEMRKDGEDRTRDAGDLIRRHPGNISNVLFADGHVSGLREAVESTDPRWLP